MVDEQGIQHKVFIQKNPNTFFKELEVYYVIEHPDHKKFVITVGPNGAPLATPLEEGQIKLEPFLRVPENMLGAIIEEFNNKVPPVKQEVIDAQLIATKYHLEDMRRLVFKGRK